MSAQWCHLWPYLSALPAGLITLQMISRLLQATVFSLACCECHQSFIVPHVCSFFHQVISPRVLRRLLQAAVFSLTCCNAISVSQSRLCWCSKNRGYQIQVPYPVGISTAGDFYCCVPSQSRLSTPWCHLWPYLPALPAGLITSKMISMLLQATVFSLTCCECHQRFSVPHVCSLVPLVALPFGAARRAYNFEEDFLALASCGFQFHLL